MSVRVMALVWEADLPPTEKLVLLALADAANDEGQCWPSAATLARKSGQGERTVRRAIHTLQSRGHLTQTQRNGTSPIYVVHPCQSGTPANPAPLPQRHGTPATAAEDPCQSGTQTIKNHKEPSNDDDPTIDDLREAWNAVAAPRGAIHCNRLTPERRRKLAPVLKRHAVEDLTEAIEAVGRSAFLTGNTPRKFRASITFLCSAEHVEKLLEGSYG